MFIVVLDVKVGEWPIDDAASMTYSHFTRPVTVSAESIIKMPHGSMSKIPPVQGPVPVSFQ